MIVEPRITQMWVSEGELVRTRSDSRKSVLGKLAGTTADRFVPRHASALQWILNIRHGTLTTPANMAAPKPTIIFRIPATVPSRSHETPDMRSFAPLAVK
jgi:hypothetical protein